MLRDSLELEQLHALGLLFRDFFIVIGCFAWSFRV